MMSSRKTTSCHLTARCRLALLSLVSVFASFVAVAHAQTPARIYEFNNSYAETNGGPAMVPNGGSLGATGYTFGAGQGPNVSNALSNTGEYSIEMVFRFEQVDAYHSILNFSGLNSDSAFYCQSSRLVFYGSGTGNSNIPDITAGQTCRVIVTRNAATKVTTAYFNGAQRSQVTDTNDFYVASTAGGILHFFRDNGTENSSGFVDRIRIYNQVLTPAQAAALGDAAGVPPSPGISLSGNATTIPDGDLLPSTAKHTRFGSVENSLARTFTIQNTGTSSLAISSIVVSGENASEFTVSGAPSSVTSGTSSTFTVTYAPVSGVATSRATVTINNSDPNEAAYDFIVEGEKSLPIAGETWTARTAAEMNGWQSVTYGNGLFVAVAETGVNRVMTSPDGIAWTARPAAQANPWRSVTYGNGLFVAVSLDGANGVMTSPDGVT